MLSKTHFNASRVEQFASDHNISRAEAYKEIAAGRLIALLQSTNGG
jgi:hypothetical protein